ncbi:MAG: LPS-assembly protein LptD [Planctomycetes bacterium]|nr:LPS-assembly protein LptD [Planctomycetota bacterium]MBI3834327.1 LPS-assembly protein LptD [Planctomycetota bacterium]
MNGPLVYRFMSQDGLNVLHFTGDFLLTLEGEGKQEIRSKEAVVWLSEGKDGNRAFKFLQIFLFRDAEITQLGGTYTTAPSLFVSLSTFGDVRVDTDDVAMQSTADSDVYKRGNLIRNAIVESGAGEPDPSISLGVLDPNGIAAAKPGRPEKPVIHFESKGELKLLEAEGGRKVMVVVGGVYLSRGSPGVTEYFEIQADSAVVYLSPGATPPSASEKNEGAKSDNRKKELNAQGGASAETESGKTSARQKPRTARHRADKQVMASSIGDVDVEAAYLEGDVRLSQGMNIIRAERVYYDFHHERAVILDAVARSSLAQRNVSLYVRADEIRQLSANEITANNAIITTSEFHTPHYHIGASQVDLINRTQPDPGGQHTGMQAGTYKIHDATFNVLGHPILWWPYLQGDVSSSETAIRSTRFGYSSKFGTEFETKWHFFNLLGIETPKGFDSTLTTEYFTKRGPAVGLNAEWEQDRYFGLMKSYAIVDHGEDKLGHERDEPTPQGFRDRFLFRHRQYLEDDWQVSLELSYISDKNFLEEYFPKEYENEKEQETILYLKKQRDNWAFTVALQSRLMDFLTQTERYPDFNLEIIGEPIGDAGTWYSENRLGVVRYRAAEQDFRDFLHNGSTPSSGGTFRTDTRQEATFPLDIGTVRAVPFVAGRGTSWSETIDKGGEYRGFAETGIRASSYFWKLYPETRSRLLDIDGIRHVIKPELTVWTSAANVDREDLFQFDDTVEGAQDLSGATVAVRQRWQTKRGRDDYRRIVDVFTNTLSAGGFSNADGNDATNGYASFWRPENSISRNFVNSASTWRINDRTSLMNEINYDISDQRVDVLNLSLAVERSPRFNYVIAYRFIDKADSNLLGFDMNYKMTDRYTTAFRELFDLERGQTLEASLAFVRRFPRWYGALSLDLDNSKDDFGVSLSFWPEGLPHTGMASRRFTGVSGLTQLGNE